MNLSAPTMPVFLVSLVIAIVALLVVLAVIPPFGVPAIWLALIAYLVLLLGNILPGL